MPQLSEIRYLVAAAENGSLRQGAETLGIGQSCVSRSVMRLEDKLGVSLLERKNTGVRLTNAGQRFLDDVQLSTSAMRLTALAEDSEERFALSPADALETYETRDAERCAIWRKRFS